MMLAAQRHELILRELELRGSLTGSEFADRAGISRMTVRRDLQQLEDQGLLKRVQGGAISLAAAAQHDAQAAHSPRPRSRPLATVGMVAPSAAYYFPAVIRGAKQAAEQLGCRLVLGISNYSAEEEYRQLSRLIAARVDGILVTTSEPVVSGSAVYRLLVDAPMPVVVVERSIDDELPGGRLESVRTDHVYGAELGINHLVDLGHSRVALAVRDTPTAPWLREGHARAVRKLHLDPESFVVELARSTVGHTEARQSLEGLLDRCIATGTRAVLVLTDEDAIALVDLALERGLRVPEDLAIVAYDDEVAALAAVPLTAVAPPKHDLGHLAMSMCFERIAQSPRGSVRALGRTSLLPVLTVRESSVPT